MSRVYEMESVLTPGEVTRVDANKFAAMREAYLAVLPTGRPGLTDPEIRALIEPILSQDHFPDGAMAGWWRKGVQLDLEAKGVIGRTLKKPARFFLL